MNEHSARAKRMERHHQRAKGGSSLNLVSLMDIFTILVFFLLVNARARPMREEKRWNFFAGPPRFVAVLFGPPIRNFESGRSPRGREIVGENPEKRKKSGQCL